MLRRVILNFLALAGLGLATGACAAPAAEPSISTVVEVVTSIATATATVGSATATVQVTATADSKTNRWCPWCRKFESAANSTYCNIVVQQPEDFDKVIKYPVLIFNHDFSVLVRTEMVNHHEPAYSWSFAPPLNSSWWDSRDSIDVVFVPSFQQNNATETPKLVYNTPHLTHDNVWSTNDKMGEVVPGVQTTIFHTSFRCRKFT